MDYDFLSLRAVGLVVGLLLIAAHAVALGRPAAVSQWLGTLPRSRVAGIALLTVDLLWTLWLWQHTDLGEFYNLRTPLTFLIPVGFVLTILFVDEFLFVRALGILLLLAAEPLLDAAFLRPEASRLLLVTLAYVWVILGMVWVAAPHLLRDALDTLRRLPSLWRLGALGGLVYGLAILACALTW